MLKILLIEDNPADARLIKELLEEEAKGSYHLEQADRLSIGLESLAGDNVDVVFLDLGLPDSKGLDTLKAVTNKAARLPVIVVTGLDDETTAIAAMRNGAQDYLLKGKIDSRVLWRVLNYAIERKQTEDSLRSKQIMLARTEGIANIGSWEWDVATDTVAWSDELFRIFQLDPQEGAPSFAEHPSFYHPDDMARLQQAVEAAVADGTPYELELRAIRKDGETRVCIARGVAEMAPDGRAVRLFGSLQDITARKLTEDSLTLSEEKYRTLVENINDVLLLLDAQGNITYMSPVVEQLSKYKVIDLVGNSFTSLIYPDDVPALLDRFTGLMSGDLKPWEFRVMDKDGRVIFVRTSSRPIYKDGEIVGITTLMTDITEGKLSEEKLLKSYESLKKTLNDAINTMVKIVELRDPYTSGHQQKVADLATAIAREMKLEDTRIDQLRMAASIHDIGKMYVPSDILSKPGRLSEIEFNLIRTHAQSGYDIVRGMDFPGVVAEAVLQHHERLDGSGYPNHLKDDDVLLEAQILAVADVIEAMVSHRPYRPALGIDKALEEISKNKGKLYAPDVVDACLELFNKGKYGFKTV